MLTNHNIGSNVEAIDQVVHLRSDDTLMGILPFFHSFGFMVTLWTVLGLDVRCVYHFTPLDAKQVGKIALHDVGAFDQQHARGIQRQVFLRLGVDCLDRHARHRSADSPLFAIGLVYVRRCNKEDFAKLEIVVAGAEKLPSSLCEAFEEKFGVRGLPASRGRLS